MHATYIEVVTDAQNYQVNISEYEKLLHLIDRGSSDIAEFKGPWGETLGFAPANVLGYIMWDEASVKRFKDYQKEQKSVGFDE